jgi:hypothetical protein
MVALLLLALGVQQPEVPDASNYERWLTFIQPDAKEQAYKEVDWRTQLWPAVQEARTLGRPILLWTMNGHPLGCT